MKKVIFTTVDNISKEDKDYLSANGFLIIEVKSLSDIKYESDIESNILLESSLDTISGDIYSAKSRFFDRLYEKLKLQKKKSS